MINDEIVPAQVNAHEHVIAGFWTRILALFVDGLILGAFGLLLGFFFSDTLMRMAGLGRFIGLLTAVLYFGLLNSSIGNGQTLGKRACKIRVVNRDNEWIPLDLSFARAFVLWLPFTLNGMMLPQGVVGVPFLSVLLGILVFGGMGAIVYLYVFNRKTRQSLHDLAVGTYVVRASTTGRLEIPRIWKGHLVITGAYCALVIIVITVLVPIISKNSVFSQFVSLQNSITSSGKAYSVSVMENNFTSIVGGNKRAENHLVVTAFTKGKPVSPQNLASEIAAIVLKDCPEVFSKDRLIIRITYGYDIGIASFSKSYADSKTPNEWTEVLKTSSKEAAI
jgi:uncharacterized RDD family membrane protein YckC